MQWLCSVPIVHHFNQQQHGAKRARGFEGEKDRIFDSFEHFVSGFILSLADEDAKEEAKALHFLACCCYRIPSFLPLPFSTFTMNPTIASSHNNNSAAALEEKLRTTVATYRQQRDEAHRSQQLATERLRLATEEAEAVAATVQTAQKNLATLQAKAGGNTAVQQEQAALQREVEHLTKEVRSASTGSA